MKRQELQETLRELGEIQRLASNIRERAGMPVVETCARWCEVYAQMAQWSLGEKDRFGMMEATSEAVLAARAQ